MAAQRRPLDFRTFDALAADVARLRERGYVQAGRWSLEQILDHLAKTMKYAQSPKRMARPVQWLMRLIFRRVVNTRSMPRVNAPKAMRPAETPVAADVDARFDAICLWVANLPGETLDHPAFGRVSVADFQQLQLIHAARHLSFLTPKPE